jgi:type III pantothenate kinase
MLLTIDAGNTNTLFAVFDGDALRGQWRLATDDERTADEYISALNQLFSLGSVDHRLIDSVIIACVVPQALNHLSELCHKWFKHSPLVVGSPELSLGLEVRVYDPVAVGADRLVNAVGAHIQYEGFLIIIDFGTATTLDVIADDGGYEGGVIAPGINLSAQALHAAAAQLPAISIEPTQAVVGKDTVQAMKSGIYWGYVSLIEGLIARIKGEIDRPCTVIATGGLADLFKNASSAIDSIEKNLTISGLLEIYKRNKGSIKKNNH